MYVVKLKPHLIEANARIAALSRTPQDGIAGTLGDVSQALGAPSTRLSGTLHNGYSEVTAQIAPGTSGTVTVTFDIVVISVASATFDLYRETLKEALGMDHEAGVAEAAGIKPQPPPAPASRMASYAQQLFSRLLFAGKLVSEQSQAFSDQDCSVSGCRRMLTAMRLLDLTEVQFSGTLMASSRSPGTAQVAAYVPITAIEFSDGLTIPFAGYSDNVLVDYRGLRPFAIPHTFWSELTGVGGPVVGAT